MLSTFGYFTGFLISSLVWGKAEGATGIIPNLRIPIGDTTFAIHHWIVSLVLIMLLLYLRTKWNISTQIFIFMISFLIGSFAQGILYKDWYIIIK